jgi:ABC-type glycerol-3-phosphate transport system substrate-binding protein
MTPQKLSRREFLRLAALSAPGIVVAACAAPASTPAAAPPTQAPAATAVPPTAALAPTSVPPPAEKIVLTVWDPLFDPQQVLLKELNNKYMEMNPNVTVKYESLQYDEVHKKVTIAMAGGGGPDAFNIPSYTWARFIDTKTAVEVDPVAFGANDLTDLESRYVPNLLQIFSVGGKISVIPTYVGSYLLLYNPVLFPDGFSPTWDKLVEASKGINRFDGDRQIATTVRMSVENPEHIHADMCPFIWTKGGDLLNEDRTKCIINAPEAVEGIAQMRKLVDAKAWVPDFPYSGKELFDKSLGAAVGGDWGFGDLDKQATEMGVSKVGLAGWPVFNQGDRTHNYMQPWGWLVSSYSKNPQQAWNLLGFYMNPENAKRWQVETSQYTGVVADWVDEMHKADPRLKLSHEQLSFSHIGLISVKYDEIMQPIVEAAQAIMYQNAPIQATLDAAATKVDSILKA